MNAHTSPTAIAASVPTGSAMLSSRAMLAAVRIQAWTARKLDKGASAEVEASHNAQSGAARVNKRLVDSGRLAPVEKAARAAREVHATMTLPWLDDGSRILPAATFDAYAAAMRTARREYEAAVEAFVADYSDAVEEARTRLGSLFREADYPSPSCVRGKFSFSFRIFPVPMGSDFRADVSDVQAARIREEIETAMSDAMAAAMRDAWERVARVAGAMAERLRAYKPATETDRAQGVFRDSLVENVRELVELLPGFNLTGDARLTEVAERMRADMAAYDAAELRDDDAARELVAQAAESVLAEAKAILDDAADMLF